MSRVRISGVRIEMPGNTPVMFLTETEGAGRTLPIYIGDTEAQAIVNAMEGREPGRPLTHDLFRDTLAALGATLERVAIVALRNQTYFAELRLNLNGQPVTVSARPSDAVALAVRTGAEIDIDTELLDRLEAEGTTVEWAEETDDEDLEPEELVDEFREFLEGLNPEDFS
ncbi:MAG TPA: bifunctional nuclease family protein [Acidimicrobiales bacterium]|nr:bifunctional nuclease family protein [Acidimicrobiales bacterium]